MTPEQIKASLVVVKAALTRGDEDMPPEVIELAGNVLLDINRIANALEDIAHSVRK